jgi:hypothetical protein
MLQLSVGILNTFSSIMIPNLDGCSFSCRTQKKC